MVNDDKRKKARGMDVKGVSTESNILVRFVTKHEQYRVSENPFSLPSNLGRSGLSEVLNHLLELDEFVPFDFAVNDHLLRSPIYKFLQYYRISTEDIITLEYFPAISVPEETNSQETDAWISCVNIYDDKFAAAGCFNGNVLIFNPSDLSISQNIQCHEEPIKSVALWENQVTKNYNLATSSKDYLIKIWDVDSSNESTHLLHNLVGHVNSVESLTQISLPTSSDDIILSGDWSGNMFGWKLPKTQSNAAEKDTSTQSKKKRKVSENKVQEITEVKSFFTVKAHGQSVSAIYSNSSFSSIYTSSWDHSFKQWDLDKLDSTLSINCSKVITSLDCNGLGLVATSHPDGRVRIWDPKSGESSNVPKISLGKTTNWIAKVNLSLFLIFVAHSAQ
jgi:ribosome biogenesis protein YTM1